MTTEDMGNPQTMEAFRQRQAERPAEVPRNIERQNRRSVLRSEKAASDTSPAGNAGVPDPVREVIQSKGQPLEGGIQRAMEDRMGDSFGDVRIHADATAAKACEEINARAFTVGNHIAFNHGEYDPESLEGQHILAHELTHVRQQTGADVSMMPQEDSGLEIDPDPSLEREAKEAAQQAMADGPVTINRMGSEMHIQRMPDAEQLQNGREQAASRNDEMTLAQTVEQLEDRVSSIEEIVTGEESVMDSVGKALSQGAVGAVGGLIGGVAGTMVSPGLGTVGGAAVGQEMAKGMAGDVTKTLTAKAYDKGTNFVAEKGNQARDFLEQLIEEKVDELLGESEHGGNTKFRD
ncbi:DUF4157 domain-containing protein [Haloterrigena longa]|uniref:DUF4157 domain-containing protein n=2 Tax=Natrinema longum TaxID=370324 RepID=A0A8A2UED3_9EURY|nr:DUF4157 domain-containing protein [Natrinema longum]QSW86983.1 DUF4157 domain-containing protein [Natrinema longum]